MIRRERAFSAMLFPGGIHAVAYRQSARGLEIGRYFRELEPGADAADAAARLAGLIAESGGAGGRLSLALSGFGSYHHILSLPIAPREVLLPVVQRELRRFFPDLFAPGEPEPIIDFVRIESAGNAPGAGTQELLAAAVPRSLLDTVRGALALHDVRLEHWTLVPRAMQRLYDAFAEGNGTDAALVLAPGSPMLGFFHRGELRLFSELSSPADGEEVEAILEQIERGALYLRQQFRGASPQRLLLAAEPEAELRGLAGEIRERLGVTVDRFGAYSESPGAMVALGAALDRGATDALNLLPSDARPRGSADRWTRRLAVASAAVLVLAAGWWGWGAVRTEQRAAAEVLRVEAELRARAPRLAEVRALVGERQAHAQRAVRLAAVASGQHRLPELLWPIQESTRDVRLDELQVGRTADGWQGTLRGTAGGATSAAASAEIDRLFRALAAEFPPDAVSLTRFGSVSPAAPAAGAEPVDEPAGIAIAFEIAFILPSAAEPAS